MQCRVSTRLKQSSHPALGRQAHQRAHRDRSTARNNTTTHPLPSRLSGWPSPALTYSCRPVRREKHSKTPSVWADAAQNKGSFPFLQFLGEYLWARGPEERLSLSLSSVFINLVFAFPHFSYSFGLLFFDSRYSTAGQSILAPSHHTHSTLRSLPSSSSSLRNSTQLNTQDALHNPHPRPPGPRRLHLRPTSQSTRRKSLLLVVQHPNLLALEPQSLRRRDGTIPIRDRQPLCHPIQLRQPVRATQYQQHERCRDP